MKKLVFITLTIMLALSACGTKKVESKYHFGYDLDYIQENFPIDNLEFKTKSDTHIFYKHNEYEYVTFCMYKDTEYIDYIMISANSKEDMIRYFELIEEEFDLFENDEELLDDLKHKEKVSDYYDGTKVGVLEPGDIWLSYSIEMHRTEISE